jgi:predicted TIM-barrel fold metal-dependent hydrolase
MLAAMSVPSTNRDWLSLTDEEALESALAICDPHHHLWDCRPDRLAPRYLLDELLDDTNAGHNVVSTVFIEVGAMFKAEGPENMRPVGEVEFVNGIAAMAASGIYGSTRVAAGIIGTAQLRIGAAIGEVLDAEIAAGGGRFRGIRLGAAWDPSPEIPNHRTNPPQHMLLHDDFRAGFAELGRRGLSFEVWCYHPQIPDVTSLARAFPETTIVLDHLGGPLGTGPYASRQQEVFEEWCGSMQELATCPNVYVKLGGLGMEVNGFGWENRPKPPTSEDMAEATHHFFDFAIEQFGVERCMFESNFPVDKLSSSYTVLWNAFKRIAAGYSPAEKALLFHDTAALVYRLQDD